MIGAEYEIRSCTKRCAITGRELHPGETVYSALIPQGGGFVRRDYALEAWRGPPPDAIGWWRFTLPESTGPATRLAPHDVLLDLLEQWEGDAQHASLRYVLALLLLRRKILRDDESNGPTEPEGMQLFCPRRGRHYRVSVVEMEQAEMDEVQRRLEVLLDAGTEALEAPHG